MSCSAGVEPTMLHNVIVAPSTSSSDHWCVSGHRGKGTGELRVWANEGGRNKPGVSYPGT